MLSLGMRVIWTKSALSMSVACLEKISICLSHNLFKLFFVLASIGAGVNLTFLWHLISAGDVITCKTVNGGKLTFFSILLDHPKVLSLCVGINYVYPLLNICLGINFKVIISDS